MNYIRIHHNFLGAKKCRKWFIQLILVCIRGTKLGPLLWNSFSASSNLALLLTKGCKLHLHPTANRVRNAKTCPWTRSPNTQYKLNIVRRKYGASHLKLQTTCKQNNLLYYTTLPSHYMLGRTTQRLLCFVLHCIAVAIALCCVVLRCVANCDM